MSKEKQEKLIKYFIGGITAAELAGVYRNTSAYYFHKLRELIYKYQEENTMFLGEI